MQEKSCTPKGIACYNQHILVNRVSARDSCLTPCHGLYADVLHKNINETVMLLDRNEKDFHMIFAEYEDYKRGYEPSYLGFFSNITEDEGTPLIKKLRKYVVGKCLNITSGKDCTMLVKQGHLVCDAQPDLECTWNVKESLQLVEIYFDTPTFDRITKDAKTNSLTKISMIGGTLGLFLGRAFIANDKLFHYLGET